MKVGAGKGFGRKIGQDNGAFQERAVPGFGSDDVVRYPLVRNFET
jgi:hypothetical protein